MAACDAFSVRPALFSVNRCANFDAFIPHILPFSRLLFVVLAVECISAASNDRLLFYPSFLFVLAASGKQAVLSVAMAASTLG